MDSGVEDATVDMLSWAGFGSRDDPCGSITRECPSPLARLGTGRFLCREGCHESELSRSEGPGSRLALQRGGWLFPAERSLGFFGSHATRVEKPKGYLELGVPD